MMVDMLLHVQLNLVGKVDLGVVHGLVIPFLGAGVGVGADDVVDGCGETEGGDVAVDGNSCASEVEGKLHGGVDFVCVGPYDAVAVDVG